MNSTFRLLTSLILVAVFPFSVCAQEVTTPPIYVSPLQVPAAAESKAPAEPGPDALKTERLKKIFNALNDIQIKLIQDSVVLDEIVDASAEVGKSRAPHPSNSVSQEKIRQLESQLQKDEKAFQVIRQNGLVLRQRLKEQEEKLKAPADNSQKYTEQIDQLKSQLSKDDKAFETIRKNGTILRQQLNDANERAQLWRQLARLRHEHMALLVKKHNALAGRQPDGASVQRQIENLQDQVKTLKKQAASAQAERDEVYHLLQRYKNRLSETSYSAQRQDDQLKDYRRQQEQLQQELRQTQDELKAKQSEIASLQQEVDHMRKEAAQQEDARSLSTEMAQIKLGEKNKRLQADIDGLKSDLQDKDKELAGIKDQLTAAEAKLKEADQSEEVARLKDMLKASREDVELLHQALKLREDEIAQLKKPATNEAQELAKAQKELEQLRAQLAKDDEAFEKIRKERTTFSDKLKEELRWKTKEVERLQEKLRQRLQKAFGNDPEYQRMSDQIKALKEGAVELIKTNGDVKHDLNACQSQLQKCSPPAAPGSSVDEDRSERI